MSEKYTCEQCGEHTYEQFSQTQVRCMHCGNVSEFDTGYRVTPQFESIAEEKVLPGQRPVLPRGSQEVFRQHRGLDVHEAVRGEDAALGGDEGILHDGMCASG